MGGVVVVYRVGLERILLQYWNPQHIRNGCCAIGISMMAIMPLGFLLGFAFPSGMRRLFEAIDSSQHRGFGGSTAQPAFWRPFWA